MTERKRSLMRAIGAGAVGLAGLAFASTAALAAPMSEASFGFGGAFDIEAGATLGNNGEINMENGGQVLVVSPDLHDLSGTVDAGDTGTLQNIADINNFDPIDDYLVLDSGVSFDLQTLMIVSRSGAPSAGFLNLYGTGSLNAPGFDPTPASISLSGTTTDDETYTLAGTISSPPQPPPGSEVPEPLSLILLGSGLAALGAVRRRRQR